MAPVPISTPLPSTSSSGTSPAGSLRSPSGRPRPSRRRNATPVVGPRYFAHRPRITSLARGGTSLARVGRNPAHQEDPMFAMPDAARLVELAASLNLRLSPKEAELYVPFVLDAMRELDTFVQSRAEEALRRCCSLSAARAIARRSPRTATRPGSGSAPSAAAIADCWPARPSASRTISASPASRRCSHRRRWRALSRRRRNRRIPGTGGRREGRRQAHDEWVHGRLRQADEPA